MLASFKLYKHRDKHNEDQHHIDSLIIYMNRKNKSMLKIMMIMISKMKYNSNRMLMRVFLPEFINILLAFLAEYGE
jgi:hypothetical protein